MISKLKKSALYFTIFSLITACHTADPVERSMSTIFQSYYEAVRDTVSEAHRAEALINIGRELEPQLNQEIRKLHLLHEQLVELNADYGSSRPEMDNQLTIIQQQRQTIRVLLLAARPDFVELTTVEEWGRLQRRSNTLIGWLSTDLERF